jgi:DNA-binding transcriptional LysR family regulator
VAVNLKRYKELRPGQLRAFCAVACHQSFSAAARELGLSHPVVWQQVRALERDFGGNLLRRRGRGVEVTEEGQAFFELASSIVASMDMLHQSFAEQRQTLPQPLVVAASATVFTGTMAPVVAKFCRQHPNVRLSVRTHQTDMIEKLVATGQADVGVVPHGSVPTQNPLLVSETICLNQWQLIVAKNHPLAAKRRLRAADLIRYPFILPSGDNPWRRTVETVLHRAGVLDQLHVVLEIDNVTAANSYVGLGVGITITPYGDHYPGFPNLCMRPLPRLFPDEHLVALWRRGATTQSPARLFLDLTRRCLADQRPHRTNT